MVLAGGKGERLSPITIGRPKPAVPFGGKYKIIDFVLSNLFNSGIRKTYILTQYQAYSLNKHIKESWGKWIGPRRILRHHLPGNDQHGRAVVHGHGRCDLSEPPLHRVVGRRIRGHLRRGPHLQDGHLPDDGLPPHEQGGHHHRRPRGVLRRGRAVRRPVRGRGPAGHVVPGKAEAPLPRARPDDLLRVHGQLYLLHEKADRGPEEGQAQIRRPRFRKARDPHDAGTGGQGLAYSFFDNNMSRHGPRTSAATGRTWGPSTPTTRRTWTSSASAPS